MKSNNIRNFVLLAFFVAIQLVLMFTPLGYIPLGAIRATTLHIPVIIGAIIFGYKAGALLGFVFGLTSLCINTFMPSPTSFVFSPFITVGGISGNYYSLCIVLLPRIMLGLSAKFFYDLIIKYKDEFLSTALSAVLATFLHTTAVLSGIYFFFGAPYASVKNIAVDGLFKVLGLVVLTNGIAEMVLAAIVSVAVVKAVKRSLI